MVSATSIGDMAFVDCSSLTSVTIGNSVTSIGRWAFSGCSGLTSVTIPNSVTSIGDYAFVNCSGLTSMTIGNSVTSIGNSAFGGCSGLTSIKVEDDNTVYDSRNNCNALIETATNILLLGCKNTVIPNSVTSIGNYAFSGCSGLTSVTIPNSVTSIGDYAFSRCSGLTSVTIPNSVTSIAGTAFSACSGIRNVFLYGDGEFQVNQGLGISSSNYTLFIKSGVTGIKGLGLSPGTIYSYRTAPPTCDANSFTAYTAALHVPESALVDYVTADYWSNFTNLTTDAIELESLSLSQTEAVLSVGGNVTLSATATPANFTPSCNVSWSSTNPAVATVYNGNVTAVGFGECDIIATLHDKTATCHVTVQEQQVVITLDKHELTMQPNKMEWLTPSMSPVSTDLVVESSDTGVAIARLSNGRVQVISVKVGIATVTVSSADGKAEPDQCLVRVMTSAGIWDVNGDGAVNVGDVNTMLADILATGGRTAAYDVNGDGNVNVGDVNAVLDVILNGAPEKTYTANGVSFKMVAVKGGTFTMGVTTSHQVTLSDYWIGETEVTEALWTAVMGSNPCNRTLGGNYPVEYVTWNDCQTFITKLNELTGETFRLPTEAEWEFAARGGNKNKGCQYAGSDNIDDVAWYSGNSGWAKHPVATKAPNELGLNDMSGNVWEWCQDWYGNYISEAQTNPTGPETGSSRVYRGGSWDFEAEYCKVSLRAYDIPSKAFTNLGLRLAQ